MAPTPPAVPAELKSLTPFLQRAHELKDKDPVISYWCTYYAAQQGIASKAKDKDAKVFLFALLENLEMMKAQMEGNDAITDDAAGSAYVENFALKVFGMADNEDRRGAATRATAKKFLAAANFLEILKIFGDIDPENEEKIRYSKWKAADIAKAFREGRTPTPGPANSTPAVDTSTLNDATSPSHQEPSNAPSSPLSAPTFADSSPRPPSLQLPTAPPPQLTRSWSTIATPGTESRPPLGGEDVDDGFPAVGNNLTQGSIPIVSTEQATPGIESHGDKTIDGSQPPQIPKKVHFTASVSDEVSDAGTNAGDFAASEGAISNQLTTVSENEEPQQSTILTSPFKATQTALPHSGSPSHSPPQASMIPPGPLPPADLWLPSAPPALPSPPLLPSAPPPPITHTAPAPKGYIPTAPSWPAGVPPSVPPPNWGYQQTPLQPPPPPPPPVEPPRVEPPRPQRYSAPAPPPPPQKEEPVYLDPSRIATIQKHAKYAISALNYEDVETARKELKKALEMLG